MARKVKWSTNAKVDFKDTLNYWLDRNKSNLYPNKLKGEVGQVVEQLSEHPLLGKKLKNRLRYLPVREYIVVYEHSDSQILIVAFWDGRRNPEDLEKLL